MDVIGIGACNLDMVAFVSKFPEEEQKINAFDYVPPRAAGVALDAITQASRLGLECGFIGKVGDDTLGNGFVKELSEDNIDTTGLITVKGASSSFAWIMVIPTGGRCHVIVPMKDGFITEEEIDGFSDYLKSAKFCHMEILQMPLKGLIKAAKLCKECGVKVSIDLDIAPRFIYEYKYADPSDLKTFFEYAYVLKVCKDGVPDLSSKSSYQDAAVEILMKYNPRIVTITLGEEGCLGAYFDSSDNVKTFRAPAFRSNKIKDTTGAGDSFQGGFIYGLLRNWSMDKVACFSNLCAILKCQRIGARSMPSAEEVKEYIEKESVDIDF